MSVNEWQFDGLVGPTHNYAGLSYGNVAAFKNAQSASNPREAALQGLKKMRFVSSLGVKQAFLPPHKRPHLQALRQLGFTGDTAAMLESAFRTGPELLASVYSASNMWTANAATVSPSICSGKVHFTPANLINKFHRSIEADFTTHSLRQIFASDDHFLVHDALPATERFGDEGAANHMRIDSVVGESGFHIYVYGKEELTLPEIKKFPARQSCDAFRQIARMHGQREDDFVLVQQSPEVIDGGAFHNDVIAMSNGPIVIAHEHAFTDKNVLIEAMKRYNEQTQYIEIKNADFSISDAVQTYFFNSQFLTVGDHMEIVAPIECVEHERAKAAFDRLIAEDNPIAQVHYLDVRESMRNGGGPACLRLRVMLNEQEAAAMHQGVVFTNARYEQLKSWVQTHYRDRLTLDDLRDPLLVTEVDAAMEALEEMIQLPGLYSGR